LAWESSFWGVPYDTFREQVDRSPHPILARRKAEPVYHVEIRAASLGSRPDLVWEAVQPWICSWTSFSGGSRWALQVVGGRKRPKFCRPFVGHDIARFAGNPSERDISGSDLACVLPIPWKDHHRGLRYVGAPQGQIPKELLPRGPGIVPGSVGSQAVQLPEGWNHLAVLGRTQTGKPSLALNLVTEILSTQPGARVVVMESTGELIRGIETRLRPGWASEVLEVDPAHPTFERNGVTIVSVPFNPLLLPEAVHSATVERERQQEVAIHGILEAFRTAWGTESIGGRAEFLLRAILQGLLSVERSNLVDAYYLLSDKQALNRFARTLPQGPVRSFLETHLPRLDYPITISSLDKLGKIATNPLLRISLCQRSHPVSFERLRRHRLLLPNLSKAAIGAEGANFLGAVYLTQLWASLQRSGRPDRPVYLFLDEAHNYAVPALADMLSEGSKFGLHVVILTQYLHRVPETVRAALLGNVGAWLLFSLGVEDMEDAWKVVSGGSHGWIPPNLVDGLRPHEVAMSIPEVLVKLRTLPNTPAGSLAEGLREAVTKSSRRYAQSEDSEASPWFVNQESVEDLLKALCERTRTRQELASGALVAVDQLEGALTWSRAPGGVELGTPAGRFCLTTRGHLHLRVLQERGNSGEEHVETLTDFAMFLRERGIAMTIPRQVPGVLLPDGQFQLGGATSNVEVECSTLAKAIGQIVRNVKKAQAAGYRVLIVLPERSRVPRILWLLAESFPGLRLWTDGVGLVWKDGRASFRPHACPGTKVWPFLGSGPGPRVPVDDEGMENPLPGPADTDPLLGQVRTAIRSLMASGKMEATLKDLQAVLPASEQSKRTEQQLGIAVTALGLARRRVRSGSTRFRLYDLRTLDSAGASADPRPRLGPMSWTDAGIGAFADEAEPQGRATDSPIETESQDPTDPTGPTD
jgi:hypothetical protein